MASTSSSSACGYKGYVIKEYFANYFLHMSDVTFDMRENRHGRCITARRSRGSVTLVDTGEDSMTGGRLRRVREYLDAGEDRSALPTVTASPDIDITAEIAFHSRARQARHRRRRCGRPAAGGALCAINDERLRLSPRSRAATAAGSMAASSCCHLEVIDLIAGRRYLVGRRAPIAPACRRRPDVRAFEHNGFWQPMDTLREKNLLEDLWQSGKAPWKNW